MRIRNVLMTMFITITLALAAYANQGNAVTFMGEERFDPLGILGPPVGAFIPSDVRVECPGFEPTGDPFLPCPLGSRTHLNNVVVLTRFTSSNTSVFPSGWITWVGNIRYGVDYTGSEWGTFTMMMDDGGILTGHWHGVRIREDDHWVLPMQLNGRISGGTLDGYTFLANERLVTYTPAPIAWSETLEGRLTNYR